MTRTPKPGVDADGSRSSGNHGRAEWLDVAKGLAIFAVMFDHANGLAFPSTRLVLASHFSVGLFIFAMGVTSFWSFKKHGNADGVARRCWKIFRPYLVATLVYCIVRHRAFDLEVFLNHVIRFNASGPLYYVLLYIQLLVAAPFLFTTCRHAGRKAFAAETATVAAVLALAAFTTNRTNILGVYGGGGKLFGGTYLVLLYLGMLFGKYAPGIETGKRMAGVLALLATCLALAWLVGAVPRRGVVDRLFPFGNGFNPPSVCLMVYAVLVAIVCFCIGAFVDAGGSGFVGKALHPLAWIGRHTLYVFLYHRLFLDAFYAGLCRLGLAKRGPPVLSGIVFFVFMTTGSLLLERILERPFRPASAK